MIFIKMAFFDDHEKEFIPIKSEYSEIKFFKEINKKAILYNIKTFKTK
jgi:hypothetical protein